MATIKVKTEGSRYTMGGVNGQFVVPAGGQVKVPGPGVVQLLVTGLAPFVRAWRMR